MKTPTQLLIQLEIIWWSVTAVVVFGVLLPIKSYWSIYPFLWSNIIFIIVLLTLARYIFLLPYTFLAHRQRLKVVLFFLCIPLVFLLTQELNRFQLFLDYNGTGALLGQPTLLENKGLTAYIYNEMLLFGVGSIISGVVFPLRLLLSVWRKRNRGTV